MRDRIGFVDGVEEVQINRAYGGQSYALRFHHSEKLRVATLEEAKVLAEHHLEDWRGARRLEREQAAAATARALRERREQEAHLARLIARLKQAGVDAREVWGSVTLTNEAAEALLGRIATAPEP